MKRVGILILFIFVLVSVACSNTANSPNSSTPSAQDAVPTNANNQADGTESLEKTELVFGSTAGPYSDQVKLGIKPLLEKKGYKVEVIEFNDYIQPNLALSEGSLDVNVFQHRVYLESFAEEHNLDLVDIIHVPTAPIGVYSKRYHSIDEVEEGVSIALPNDPTNQARALLMLDQFGWIVLDKEVEPIRVSEKDIIQNVRNVRLIPLEAAQLPRSLDDTDLSFINGNFALASGLSLTEAIALEDTPEFYMNLVAVRSEDKDKDFVQDIVEAYQSAQFKELTETEFAGFVQPEYQR